MCRVSVLYGYPARNVLVPIQHKMHVVIGISHMGSKGAMGTVENGIDKFAAGWLA